jgi:hypothetical protein
LQEYKQSGLQETLSGRTLLQLCPHGYQQMKTLLREAALSSRTEQAVAAEMAKLAVDTDLIAPARSARRSSISPL